MSVRLSRPLLRWLVPLAVVVAVGLGVAVAAGLGASANAPLPNRSPAQLIADIRGTTVDGFSGTLQERADLGLPDDLTDSVGDGSSEFASLIAGAHTLRVWYAGSRLSRVALLGALGESDLIRNGGDLWIWSSTDNSATHVVVPATPVRTGSPPVPTGLPTTPQEAASALLSALDPSTSVTVGPNVTVAGRPAYTLVVTPRDAESLVGQVRVAVDGRTHLPLRVQVYARGTAKPAFELGFSQVSFEVPDAAMFRFNPPRSTTIKKFVPGSRDDNLPPDAPRSVVIGSGWTAVLAIRLPVPAGTRTDDLPYGLGKLIDKLPPAPHIGGHVLTARLFTALVTDDNRLLIGAVSVDQLLRAAAAPEAALTAPPPSPPAHR